MRIVDAQIHIWNGGLPTAALPTLLRPDTADAGTHGQRTPTGDRTPNTGDRPADTWTLRRPHRTLDAGRVDRHACPVVARTGHWTPDAGRGHRQGDEGTAGSRTSWTTTPSDRALGRPTVFLWTGPAGSAAHAGSAVRSPAGARLPLALPCSARSLRRPRRASAHCSPQTITGRA